MFIDWGVRNAKMRLRADPSQGSDLCTTVLSTYVHPRVQNNPPIFYDPTQRMPWLKFVFVSNIVDINTSYDVKKCVNPYVRMSFILI